MISVKIEGRLGNQLFQYAFIYATAKKLNTNFYVDKRTERFLILRYFNVPKDFFYLLDRYLFSIKDPKHFFRHHLKKAFYKSVQYMFGLRTINFSSYISPKEELKKLKNKTIYEGFFQSEYYFKEVNDELKKIFSIKKEYEKQYLEVSRKIPKNTTMIVVHIRKGDYIDLGFNLPTSYYHRAIKGLKVDNPFFIFISDEPETIETDFAYLNNIYISRNNEIVDFQLLLNADICILSNSTFSWWGSYLNKKKPQTIVPKYWLDSENTEFPHSIICSNWLKL